MNHDHPNFEVTPSPKRKTAASVTVVLCLLAGNFYLYSRVNRAEVDAHTFKQTLEEKLAGVESKSIFHLNNAQREIEGLRESLEEARSEASNRAKSEARRQTDKLSRKIAAQQRSAKELVMSEVRTLGDKAFETAGKVEGIEGELGGVKDELAGTVERLESTDSVLKDTKAHMRSIGDWVAGNASEISKLREKGGRRFVRFQLSTSEKMSRVGDVRMRLRKTNPKRNKYTVEILADDKKIVKKGQYANEPVEFYVAHHREPYEVVMTTIKKDHVMGFLSRPKEVSLRR